MSSESLLRIVELARWAAPDTMFWLRHPNLSRGFCLHLEAGELGFWKLF